MGRLTSYSDLWDLQKEWENKSEQTGIHSMESTGVVSKPVPMLICVCSYHQDLRWFKNNLLPTRSASYKTCLIITTVGCFCSAFAVRSLFVDQIGILTVVFALDCW